MATVTGFTAERMLEIENSTVVDGEVVGDNLMLIRRDGIQIDAGNVRGPTGATGPIGMPVPPGTIVMFGGPVCPAGWVFCDWALYSRTAEAGLFAAIGETWGPGDGVNTFNAPLLQERIPVGKGAAAWANALAKTGGSKDLIVVAHQHDIGHAHTVAAHDHDMSHGHTGSSDWQSSNHQHQGATAQNYVPGYARSPLSNDRIAGIASTYFDRSLQVFNNANGSADAGIQLRSLGELILQSTDHAHTNQGWGDTNHYHGVGVSNFNGRVPSAGGQTLNHAGQSVSTGAAGTDKNLPPYVVVNFIVKL